MRPVRLTIPLAILASLLAAPALQAQTPVRTASAGMAAEPARDTAIAKLSAFLDRYPASPLRANALFQLGELLVRRADAEFEATLRATTGDTLRGAEAPVRPHYEPAIARFEELVRRFPDFDQRDAAAYTLGTLQFRVGRYADAAESFEHVTDSDTSRFRPEAFFRLGDSYFEVASRERGAQRQADFARAARAYEQAVNAAPKGGDIYFLSLYKLGWAYYNQATRANQEEYRQAVSTFGRLVAEYDQLSREEQERLGLRSEAIEYMAIAFTQVGGAEAANQFFTSRGGADYKLPVLRRVAANLREQGEFTRAVDAYRAVIAEAPTDSGALAAQREIVDIYQNRAREMEAAQQARLELVERFAPGTPWAAANPGLADSARVAREEALRQSGQYALAQAQAQRGQRAQYARAAELYGRYMQEFAQADSAQRVAFLYGEALYGQGEYARAGAAYEQAAYQYAGRSDTLARLAGQNAIVALDSALMRSRADTAAQNAFFGTVDRFVAAFPQTDIARHALQQKGRRASEAQRWDVMAATFRTYAERYPNDPYTPTAQRFVADALYRQGQYAEAQQQWETARQVAVQSGRRALADSIARLQTSAAATFADTLVRRGEYRRAAEEVYVAFADRSPRDPTAPDALRNAIETYMLADSAARARGDDGASRQARDRAIELSSRLVTQYPTYRYRTQYQTLQARLLAETGRSSEAVEALRAVVASSSGTAKADAMVRLAVALDSLDRDVESAQAYEQFVQAFPRDQRAAGAQYNAAILYREEGDNAAAARAFGTFVQRFPNHERAAEARTARVALLRAAGDSTAANAELARLCARPTAELRAECAARAGEAAFRQGVALWPRYKGERLVIRTIGQLTQAGVQRASAQKQSLLRTMTGHFTRAIQSGSPEWLAAATYYVGLAQWEYGDFLKNVNLPETLTPEQREAALQGSAQQAETNYTAARRTWQSLLDKAQAEGISNAWVDRTRDALAGNVPESPPTSSHGGVPATVGGME